MSSGMCGCCSPLRPRFKRLIDNIFPANSEDGLVKSHMETLTYYAATSPEKLDRIGEYLAYRIGRDIYRNRKGFVIIGMEAMDVLLKSCHSQSLNLYIESFLKTVQKLLESSEPELQILASQSFFQYSQIEEDTPNYHRSYDFLIDRFSQMCHGEHPDPEMQQKIRVSGLLGLNGVVRKTVNEDLAENIWDPKHMDKIIPSLLFNMDNPPPPAASPVGGNNRDTPDLGTGEDDQTPHKMADQLLRELVKASSFSTIKNILQPTLVHIDDHKLWDEPNQVRAVHTFEAIMYSIQVDLSYIVIDKLIGHLDSTAVIKIKGSIASVLSKVIGIGVGDSTVGPSVLEIINKLLKHLRKAVVDAASTAGGFYVPQYHEALLQALGEYVGRLPDFQMIEIMTFILSKVPIVTGLEESSEQQQLPHVLLKALYCVAFKYTSKYFTTTFSPQFLSPLLRQLQSADQDVRLMVLQIFQTLVDRHDNLEKLTKPTLRPSNLGLNGFPNKFNRADQMFTQKTLFHVYNTFKKVLEESNTVEFLEAIYTTCALLVVETSASDDGTFYLLDLIESMQNIAVHNLSLSTENRFSLHAITICLLSLLAATVNLPEIDNYVETVIAAREERAPHMLPPLNEEYHPGLDPNTPEEMVLIQQDPIKEALKNAGKNVQRMDSLPRRHSPHNSWVEPLSSAGHSRRPSSVSASSIGLDFDGDSNASSPGIVKKSFNGDVSVTAFRKLLEGASTREREEEERRQKEILAKFLHSSFEEVLTELQDADGGNSLQDTLQDIFSRVAFNERQKNEDDEVYSIMKDPAPYEKIFPEIFMY